MLETFQDRLVTELRLARASSIDEAGLVLQEFLPRFNARFAVAAEQPEAAYRLVPAELSLTETICLKDTRKVARDNTVKYHWRALQLLPGAERPSYVGPPGGGLGTGRRGAAAPVPGRGRGFSGRARRPPRCCGGADTGCSPDPGLHEVAEGTASSHLNKAQRERLATLESSDQDEVNVEGKGAQRRGGKGKPVRHRLHRTPTATQQARWEAVQRARSRGFPSGPLPESGHGQNTAKNVRRGWRSTHQETQRQGASQGRGSGRTASGSQLSPGDIFAFQLRGHNRWTTTGLAGAGGGCARPGRRLRAFPGGRSARGDSGGNSGVYRRGLIARIL